MITVIGTVFVDIIGKSQVLFEATGRNIGLVETRYGGVGHNVARNLAALGNNTSFVSSVEPNATGDDIINKLRESGIDVRYVYKADKGMGVWQAILDDRGELAASISQQPDFTFLAKQIKDRTSIIFSETNAIALELDLTEEIAEISVAFAQKACIPVYAIVSNLSVAKNRPDLLSQCDLLVVNQLEAFTLLDLPTDAKLDIALCQKLVQKYGIDKSVVTMGESGSQSYARNEGVVNFQPAIPTDITDVSGAGDAFYSGTVFGLRKGRKLHEACLLGSQAAAMTIACDDAVCSRLKLVNQ